MKIVAINGSPRGMWGNTGRLVEEVLMGATLEGAKVRLFPLSELPVRPCLGCDACHRVGFCPTTDPFEAIKAALLAADGFVLASPNYLSSVSAQMKALFDRCCGLVHCTALEGKYAAVVATSGGEQGDGVVEYMRKFVASLGALCVGGIEGQAAAPRRLADEERLFKGARLLGRELVLSAQGKRDFPEQAPVREAGRERMRQLVGRMGGIWHYEKEFWAQR